MSNGLLIEVPNEKQSTWRRPRKTPAICVRGPNYALQIARALSDHKAAENLRAVAAQYFVRTLEAEGRLGTPSRISFLLKKWRALMARYFFPANYRGISVNDDVGEEFSSLQDAEAHATIVANELGHHSSQAVTVSVFSEDGILLAKRRHLSESVLSPRASISLAGQRKAVQTRQGR